MSNLEKAVDSEDFIRKVANELDGDFIVYFNLETLEYGTSREEWNEEYGEVLDLQEEYFKQEIEDWHPEDKDMVESIYEAMKLPDCIEPPESYIQFQWMVDFTEEHASNRKFFQYAEKALNRQHPFRGFKDTVLYNGLEKEWYAYKEMRMQNWVRNELPFYKTERNAEGYC